MRKLFLWTFALMMLCAWSVALVPRHVRADTTSVILIPDDAGDRVCMFDPYDGTYLGDFISEYVGFDYPRNAISGPDGNIYISDDASDAVFVFDRNGNYLSTYADLATDGLDQPLGMDFRGDHLFVTFYAEEPEGVAEFDGPHSRLADFINDDNSPPNDIFFLEDGRSLVSVQEGSPGVRLYSSDGTTYTVVLTAGYMPTQIQGDPQSPGSYLVTKTFDNQIVDFDIDGTIHQTITIPFDYPLSVYRLGNGNLLVGTYFDGVYELDATTGEIVETEHPDVAGWFAELCVVNVEPPGYPYLPGDVNMALGIWPPSVIGGDVTYLVGYFIGGGQAACMLDGFWCSADINGDCQIIGGDVTALVGYFIAGGDLVPCPDYASAWLEGIPDEQPSGWPNCDVPVINSKVIPTGSVK